MQCGSFCHSRPRFEWHYVLRKIETHAFVNKATRRKMSNIRPRLTCTKALFLPGRERDSIAPSPPRAFSIPYNSTFLSWTRITILGGFSQQFTAHPIAFQLQYGDNRTTLEEGREVRVPQNKFSCLFHWALDGLLRRDGNICKCSQYQVS